MAKRLTRAPIGRLTADDIVHRDTMDVVNAQFLPVAEQRPELVKYRATISTNGIDGYTRVGLSCAVRQLEITSRAERSAVYVEELGRSKFSEGHTATVIIESRLTAERISALCSGKAAWKLLSIAPVLTDEELDALECEAREDLDDQVSVQRYG